MILGTLEVQDLLSVTEVPQDHRTIPILQNMISSIPLLLGLRSRMLIPCVYVVFWALILEAFAMYSIYIICSMSIPYTIYPFRIFVVSWAPRVGHLPFVPSVTASQLCWTRGAWLWQPPPRSAPVRGKSVFFCCTSFCCAGARR